MVRLQLPAPSQAPLSEGVSIPLWFDCNLVRGGSSEIEKKGLHPTMVRLQPRKSRPDTWVLSVSIPLWFDCNSDSFMSEEHLKEGLHPTMVRLQLLVRVLDLSPKGGVSIPLWFDCNIAQGE